MLDVQVGVQGETSFPSPPASNLKFGLAPMEGVSDLPFRLWISMTSDPEWTSTPFLRVTDTYPPKLPLTFFPELDEFPNQVRYQLVPQLMASRPEDFVRIAKVLLPSSPFVDLNCGCPSPNSVGSKAGSHLLQNQQKFRHFIETIVNHIGERQLSIKMRLGFERVEEFHQLLEELQDFNLAQICIHGRTRSQRYSGWSRWDYIEKASRNLKSTIVGSGDILSWDSVRLRERHCQSLKKIIVGRGALRNPWIFLELRQQQPIAIKPRTLVLAFLCYALLVELFRCRIDSLMQLIKNGVFQDACLTDERKWFVLFEELSLARFGIKNPEHQHFDELDRTVLGRVKLVWNYFRSSLPTLFFDPKLLRSSSISMWLAQIEKVIEQYQADLIPLQYEPSYDWIYTSDKKPPGPFPSDLNPELIS